VLATGSQIGQKSNDNDDNDNNKNNTRLVIIHIVGTSNMLTFDDDL